MPEKPPEPDPKTKAEAKKLIRGGDKFIRRGDYYERKQRHEKAQDEFARALAAYQKAYDLVPNVQIYFAIAGAEARLGRWLDAAVHLRKVLTEGGDRPQRRAQGRRDPEARRGQAAHRHRHPHRDSRRRRP